MWKFVLNKMFKMREKFAVDLGGKGDEEKPFLEHLEDLRTMIVRMAITLIAATIGTFCFYDKLFDVIKAPLWFSGVVKTDAELKAMLQFLNPSEGFMMMMNLAFIAAIIVSFPFLLMFLLQFILPGLKKNEKKLIFPMIGVGVGLFLTGLLFAYYLVLPRALQFFASFNDDIGVANSWRVSEYVTFATRFVLVFGISFELPILVMALVKLDILNYQLMKGTRAHAIVAIAIFAAVITPTQDALTMLLMVAPLYFLYEICIWLAYYMNKKDREEYPEYYKELDKDAEEAVKDDWDNEDYNPWSTAASDDDDEDELVTKKPVSPTVPASTEPATDEPATDEPATDEPLTDEPPAEAAPKPESEKTLEDYAREDEERNKD